MDREISIKVENLNKSYGGVPVLENVSFEADSSRPLCIMAPSGAGKTTLASVIMGLEKADSGSVSGVKGRRISAVFQEDRLCEALSAVMNVQVASGAGRRRTEYLLERLGLTRREIYRPVSRLSGGQRRRVAIARALAAESDIIIMDEPFKGLDEDTRRAAVRLTRRQTEGKLLIVITHDGREARLLGGNIFRL